jgi:hypothetical protein
MGLAPGMGLRLASTEASRNGPEVYAAYSGAATSMDAIIEPGGGQVGDQLVIVDPSRPPRRGASAANQLIQLRPFSALVRHGQ